MRTQFSIGYNFYVYYVAASSNQSPSPSFNPPTQRRETVIGGRCGNCGWRVAAIQSRRNKVRTQFFIGYNFYVYYVAVSSNHSPSFNPPTQRRTTMIGGRCGNCVRQAAAIQSWGNKVRMQFFIGCIFVCLFVAVSSNHFPSPSFNPPTQRRATMIGGQCGNCVRRVSGTNMPRK